MGFKSTHNSTTKRNLKADNSFKHKNKSYSKSSSSDESNTRKPRSRTRNDKGLPIPKGDSPYALAKQAEYKERDLDKAEAYYKLAIKNGERVESAIKDLASLLHQRGKTEQACKLLKAYKHLFFYDMEKFENLLGTLCKQVTKSGNSLKKSLKLSFLKPEDNQKTVRALFSNSVRILEVSLDHEICEDKDNFFAILKFNSHSSARKTLEGFSHWDTFRIEWVSDTGEVLGDAHYARHKMEEYRKHNPTFDYLMFERDPKGYVLSMPVDGTGLRVTEFKDCEDTAKLLLGSELFKDIF
mmetsp:Transcript_12359/g.18001  ORF Transcript_12359/g.18001 Transcript_12359/m.18001 type:complete len:297 (+) Transcript_12359:22-912(+)